MSLFAAIGMRINVYAAGVNGSITTNLAGSYSRRVQTYEHAISASVGFESMQWTFTGNLSEARTWLREGLMQSIIVYGPDTEVVWEGYITQVDVNFGTKARSVSLDSMANRVRVRYTTVLDTPGVTANVDDAYSQAVYGVKDYVESLNKSTSTDAGNAAAAILASMKNPRMQPTTAIQTGDITSGAAITVMCAGWYTTLDWVLTSRTSTTNTATGTQIGDLLSTSSPGIGQTNAFLSTVTGRIGTTGITATEYIEQDTPYRAKIESLVALGDGTDRWVLMCLEGRQLWFQKWAGAAPGTIDYQSSLRSRQIYDLSGGWVRPWRVRPDTMYIERDLLDPSPVSTQQDAAARQYVERVRCTIGETDMGCDLEPQASDSLAVKLARWNR